MQISKDKKKLLIVEDDLGLQKQLRWNFDSYDVLVAIDKESALLQVKDQGPAVVTMDLGLPPDPDGATEGLATLKEMLVIAPNIKVIVLTGNQEHANALEAIKIGAYDFHQKPFNPETLGLVVERAFYLYALQNENRNLLLTQAVTSIPGFITHDPVLIEICKKITKVALSDASVMLLGESGTGKEILANELHRLNSRKDNRFIAINCAAIPGELLESELFGYEKGAYTGAAKQTKGKIELASGGTFFLDEVGDLPMQLQAKLLRFLQERVIERLGGHEEIAVDVRIVCATHQNLQEMVKAGRFREDLYYRLSEIVITIPPLRDRVADIMFLIQYFLHKFSEKEGLPTLNLSEKALIAINNYQWPGNVREMENCIKRAIIMAEGAEINEDDLGLPISGKEIETVNLREVRVQEEGRALVRALARASGNIAKAAGLLGVSRPTIYTLMDRHGLK